MKLLITPHIDRLIELALDEDRTGFDVTSQAFFEGQEAQAIFKVKSDLVVSGLELVRAVFHRVDPALVFEPSCKDGDMIARGGELGRARGPVTSLLSAERTALNFIQRMCGIATKTNAYVQALNNDKIRLCDTRKTLPGYRELDKYAVRCGGGYNHRFDLGAGVMIKDNHIAAAGSIDEAMRRVRELAPHTLRVEVEVGQVEQVSDALKAGAEIIMLDNMSTADMARAIEIIRAHKYGARTVVEASGNVTIERLPELGQLDLNVVSTGAITHSIEAADISMKIAR